MSRIRIMLAEDHQVVREGLRALFSVVTDFAVVREATDGLAAVEMAQSLRPDVVIMDVGLPRLSGLDATQRIV